MLIKLLMICLVILLLILASSSLNSYRLTIIVLAWLTSSACAALLLNLDSSWEEVVDWWGCIEHEAIRVASLANTRGLGLKNSPLRLLLLLNVLRYLRLLFQRVHLFQINNFLLTRRGRLLLMFLRPINLALALMARRTTCLSLLIWRNWFFLLIETGLLVFW